MGKSKLLKFSVIGEKRVRLGLEKSEEMSEFPYLGPMCLRMVVWRQKLKKRLWEGTIRLSKTQKKREEIDIFHVSLFIFLSLYISLSRKREKKSLRRKRVITK